ncbi:MAG: hypothetical protein ABFD69_05020 [Candidatus Sumerlaeia bacterium]
MRDVFAKLFKAVGLYLRHFVILAALALALNAPLFFLVEYARFRGFKPGVVSAFESVGALFFTPLFIGTLIEALRLVTGRERAGFFHCIGVGLSRWFALVVNFFLSILMIAVSFLHGLAGLVMMVKLSLMGPVVVIEKLSGKAAMDRSEALTDGWRWKIVGSVMLLATALAGLQHGAEICFAAHPIAWASAWWFPAAAKTLRLLAGLPMHVILFLYYRDAWLLDVIKSSDGRLIVIDRPDPEPASPYTTGRKDYPARQ